jgi:predicted LPLAT superfamily acyltransferase
VQQHKGWLDQPERGNLLAMKVLVWVALHFGRSFVRLFMVPICIYFILFSCEARSNSLNYLRRVLPRCPTWRDVVRHYHAFASTIHDRIYMLSGQFDRYDVRVHGFEEIEPLIRQQGCILLGSHLGSFEVLRTIGASKRSLPINVLMHEANARKFNSIWQELNPVLQLGVIALGKPDTMLKVQECIERKEIVGMLGDRTFTGDKNVGCDFLGGPVTLPQGPFALASILGAPVILFFGLYLGGNRYDLHFELFEADPAVERRQRAARIALWAQRYADRLAHYCRLAPYNWFNFYRYWD